MQLKIFTIPVLGGELMTEEMNKFLRSKKILQVETQMVSQNQGACWSFCIKYLDDRTEVVTKRKSKTDYRKVLDEASFQRFSKMREIRKRVAKEEAIPAFAIFSDEEMAGLAKIEGELTPAKMKSVRGIGDKKVEKYGRYFLPQKPEDEKS